MGYDPPPPEPVVVVPEPEPVVVVPEPEPVVVVPEPEPVVVVPEPEPEPEDEVDDEDVPVQRAAALIEEALNASYIKPSSR